MTFNLECCYCIVIFFSDYQSDWFVELCCVMDFVIFVNILYLIIGPFFRMIIISWKYQIWPLLWHPTSPIPCQTFVAVILSTCYSFKVGNMPVPFLFNTLLIVNNKKWYLDNKSAMIILFHAKKSAKCIIFDRVGLVRFQN